ncbi:hypothetical protein Tco_1218066 [Tanacetum coccineum]
MSSSSSHATVTASRGSAYITIHITYLLSPDYVADSEPSKEEELKEDPEDDLKEEPSEEEELSASADSPPARLYIDLPSEGTDICPTPDLLPVSLNALVDNWVAAPTPPSPSPSLLSPLSSPLPMIPSPPLQLSPPTRRDIIPKADMPPRKRARFAAPSHRFKIRESLELWLRRDDADRLTRHIQRDRAREDARDPEHHDGPADAGSSC